MNKFTIYPSKSVGTLGLIFIAALSACGGGSGSTNSRGDGSSGATLLATIVTSTTRTVPTTLLPSTVQTVRTNLITTTTQTVPVTSTTANAPTILVTATPIVPIKVLPVNPTIQSLGLLGGNLGGITDYDSTQPFVDLMKQARKLGTANAPWDGLAVIGSDGWPVGDFGVVLMVGQSDAKGISGVYKFSFTGNAEVGTMATSAQVQNILYDSATNKTTGEINIPTGEGNLFLVIKNTHGSIKDLKVIRPGYLLDNFPVFRTEFLAHIKRAQLLRFMDWSLTNNNTTVTWAERANPSTTHDAHLGASWEDIIKLANLTGTPIWINIPAMADDDYVRNLAELINTQLKLKIPVYIEYSNELWNFSFQQAGYNAVTARAEIASNSQSPLNFDQKGDNWGFRRTANRTKQISDIFRSVVGDSKMMAIFRPIIAGQIVNPEIIKDGLKMIQTVYGAPKQYFYGLAGAPYFSLGGLQTQVGLSTTQVLDALEQSAIASPKVARYETNSALAAWYGLKFYAYEAGLDTFGDGSLEAKEAANNDPRMQSICETYLTNWYQAGFDTLNWFTLGAGSWKTKYGTWPITYDLSVSTPKTACFDSTNAKTLPAISTRHMVPGTWDAREQPDVFPPYSDLYIRWIHQPIYSEFMFYADKAGNYTLTLTGGAQSQTNGSNTVNISLNNTILVPAFAMTLTLNYASAAQAPIQMQLKKGINVLHFSSAQPSDSWYLKEINIR